MKNKLKYLIAVALVAVFVLSTGVCALASEADSTAETDTVADNAEVTLHEDTNLFSRVYRELTEYAAEILAALTLAGSVALAVAYKKGLLPLLEKSLLTIGNAITKIKENTKQSADKSSEMSDAIDKKLTEASDTLEKLSRSVLELKCAMEEGSRNDENDRLAAEQLRIVMDAQIEMLYDVFMFSALPQYQKDTVGERIAKMKEAIGESVREK